MGQVTAQLLFVDQPDAHSVRLDVIVLDLAEAELSPPVGAPLAFWFGMPTEADERARVLTVLGNWARRGAAVEIDVNTGRGVVEVVLRSGVACIALDPDVSPERRSRP